MRIFLCVIDTCVYVCERKSSKINRGPRKRTRPVGSVLYLRRLDLEARDNKEKRENIIAFFIVFKDRPPP